MIYGITNRLLQPCITLAKAWRFSIFCFRNCQKTCEKLSLRYYLKLWLHT